MTARLLVACLALPLLAAAADPPEVPVASPVVREIADFIELTGRVEPAAQVEIRARATGYLERASFNDGAEVKKGQPLFEIDGRSLQAELARAEAALAAGDAKLRRLSAQLERARALQKQFVVGQEEFERIAGEHTEAEAEVAAARAAVQAARIQLGYLKVQAPIAGRIGRRAIDVGNLVKANETVLATVVATRPARVVFALDERTVLRLRGGKGREGTTVEVALADEQGFPHVGKIDFVDNRIDPATGTLAVRATLPNDTDRFLPGMTCRVRLPLGEPHKVLVLPPRAGLHHDGTGHFVLVVGEKDRLEKRAVVLGGRVGADFAVREGLVEKDRVVCAVGDEVREGVVVKPVAAKP